MAHLRILKKRRQKYNMSGWYKDKMYVPIKQQTNNNNNVFI